MNIYTPPTGCDTCDNHQPDIYTIANEPNPALDLHRILHDNLRTLFNPILNWPQNPTRSK